MSTYSTDVINRREAARKRGRFGEQHRSAPELQLGRVSHFALVDDAWDDRQTFARQVESATVNLAISRLPPSVKGLRFTVDGARLAPARILPADPRKPVDLTEDFIQDLDTISVYAQNRSHYVELDPIHDEPNSWDWVPSAEQRSVPAEFSETAREDALAGFRDADREFNDMAVTYLREQMPEGVDSIEVIYAETPGRIGTVTAPLIVGAYDEEGELVHADFGSRALAGYRVTVARTDITRFPVRYTESGSAIYTITKD